MALAARTVRVSEEEFLARPESNQHVELIDGEVIVSPSPTFQHQRIIARLLFALETWRQRSGFPGTIVASPLDVRLGRDRIVQPDVVVFAEALPADVPMPITIRPLVCVEVVSTDRVYDRVTKRMLYGAAGIPELWCVEGSGEIERFFGANLADAQRYDDRFTSPLLPGFELAQESLVAP